MERRTLRLVIEERLGRVDHVVYDTFDNQSRYVTGFSCDCGDFLRRGSCLHHTFLIDSLGWNAAPVSATVGMEIAR